jgi:osmoprotectant transport system permease protein
VTLDAAGFVAWLTGDPWFGLPGVPSLILQHLWYALPPALAAILAAVPPGLWLGHTGRGGLVAINLANTGRAIPSFGLLLIAFLLFGLGVWPIWIALFALAVPPILTNTYVGLRQVDPDVRDAARGMGLRGREVLLRVELPLAVPVLLAGIRTSTVQVVATATLGAWAGLGGLGAPIRAGLAQNIFANPNARAQALTGSIVVAVLAVAVEAVLATVERRVTPAGVRARDTVEQGVMTDETAKIAA